LLDIGAGFIPTVSLNTLAYDDARLRHFQGIVFVTYTTSVGKTRLESGMTRVDQLVVWAQAGGEEFNGVMVFDEGGCGRGGGGGGEGGGGWSADPGVTDSFPSFPSLSSLPFIQATKPRNFYPRRIRPSAQEGTKRAARRRSAWRRSSNACPGRGSAT
jgi:hypothetical protein